MKKTIFIISTLLLLVGICSCKKEIITPEENFLGKSFVPTELGHYVTYKVDSTIYDNFADTVYTQTSEIRELIESEFTDNEGRPAVRIARQFRKDASTAWENAATQMTYAVRTDEAYERVVDNLRFIPLVFPVEDGKSWRGNAFLDTENPSLTNYDDWLYRYFNEGIEQQFSGVTFENTVSVSQNDYNNAAEYIFSKEIYAENVGLIFKEQSFLELVSTSLPPLETNPWPERANTGVTVVWQVIDFN